MPGSWRLDPTAHKLAMCGWLADSFVVPHPPGYEGILQGDQGSLPRWVPGMGRRGYSFCPVRRESAFRSPGPQPLSLEELTVSRAVSSAGQFVCHPVHDPGQGESGPRPEGGGDRQREPRGDDGESVPPPPPLNPSPPAGTALLGG